MNHAYSFLLPRQLRRWAHRSVYTLGLLATAGAAHAQTPAATFGPATAFSSGGIGPSGIVVADVNGDGKPDLLTTNVNSATVAVLLGTGAGSFGTPTTYSTGSSGPRNLAVADVNGDGKLDLVITGGGTVSVLLGTGTGSFGATPVFSPGGGFDIEVADVNGDGKPDLLTIGGGTVLVQLGTGTGSFGAPTTYSVGGDPRSLAVADVNGDGKLDVLTTIPISSNLNAGAVAVLLGTGTGSFGAPALYSVGPYDPYDIAVADVNGDGKLDVLTTNTRLTVSVLLGTGTGTFGGYGVKGYGVGFNAGPKLAVADVNGDGALDLLATGYAGTVSVLLGTGTGTFVNSTTLSTGGYSSDVAVADVNGDGKPDLLTTDFSSNTVLVQLNTTGLATAPTVTSLSPATGPVGTSVTITGINLSGATGVSFNGVGASSFVVNSATSITAVVAVGTTDGTVRVFTPDGTATSSTSFVVRYAPTTVADSYTTPVGVTLTGNVLANDIGTNPVAILIIRPTNGTLALNPDGTFTYQPNTGYVGSDSFLYYACDPGVPLLCGNPVTVTINVVRVAPITVADAYTVRQGVTLTGNVLSNDIGPNPQAILIIRPTHGTLLLNPNGTFTYQPTAGYVGPDSFIYYACNMGTPLVCGDPATVSITVTPATPSLTATKPAASASATRGAATAVTGPAAQELQLTGYPNPFSDDLQLSFTLPIAQAYTLAVYDAQGRLVQQLARGQAEAGQVQELTVPTATYATGLYLVRLTTATGSQLLKLIKQ